MKSRRNFVSVSRLILGIGPATAAALAALAPPAETFTRGRDFAAWVELTPLQHSTGGKQKLGATSKMGERQHGTACARHGRGQGQNPPGMLARHDLRDHPAHRTSDDMRLVDGEGVEQSDGIRRHVMERIGNLGPLSGSQLCRQ
jgi:hypothetical protein